MLFRFAVEPVNLKIYCFTISFKYINIRVIITIAFVYTRIVLRNTFFLCLDLDNTVIYKVSF